MRWEDEVLAAGDEEQLSKRKHASADVSSTELRWRSSSRYQWFRHTLANNRLDISRRYTPLRSELLSAGGPVSKARGGCPSAQDFLAAEHGLLCIWNDVRLKPSERQRTLDVAQLPVNLLFIDCHAVPLDQEKG